MNLPEIDPTILAIIARKQSGTDCTEQESAEIKMWLKELRMPHEQPTVAQIQFLFPLEYSEAMNELDPEETK